MQVFTKRLATMVYLNISPAVKQYGIVIIANFTAFHLGLSVGWLSPVMVKLRAEEQTVLPRPLSENEMAWILSVSCLSALSAFTFTGYIADNLGRKTSLILACIPRLASCILFIFANSYWMLVFGRVLCGLSDYEAITLSAMYSSEIAGKEIRGGLGSVNQIMSSLGAMLMLSIGPFVSVHTINIILTCVSFGTCLPLLFLPESPYFLYSKGRINEAEKLLTFLRGSKIIALDEMDEYSSQISVTVNRSSLIKDKVILKTVGKVIFLGISLQTIGTNAITFYLQTIFESTNTSVRPEISSAVIGCIQLFACFCTILITDRFGRKPVLVVSLIGMTVGMIGLGTFFHLQTSGNTISGWLNYLPLVSMILVIYCNNLANFTAFHLGLSVGWLSPVMVKLRAEEQTVLPRPLSENEMAWILSVSCLSALSAFTFTGYIADNLGRKTSLILACIPRLASCILFIFANSYWMLVFGRVLCGLSDYEAITLSAMYSSEIAGKEIRGGLGSVNQIMSSLGAMLMLSIGPFVSVHTINIILTCVSFGTCLPLLFLPESPYFLYSKGRINEAEKLLTFLRGSKIIALDEMDEYSSQISVTVNRSSLIKDKVILKTVGKVIFLGISLQTIGTNAITFYLQTIFESTNTSVRPEISSAVIGCIQLFACFCTILITDRFGRKPVLVVSLIGMTVGMIGLGTFFHLQTSGNTISGWLNYLPLVSMILVIYCNNLGMGSLLWTVIAELFDGPARAMGVSIGVFVSIATMFPINRYFAAVSHALGPATTYWMFSASCAITCLFIARLVPETKGRAISQIQRDMGRAGDNK